MSRPPQTITVDESEKLLDVFRKEGGTKVKHWKNLRNYTMTLLMLDTGIRVGELVQLKNNDFIVKDTLKDTLLLPWYITKTKKERTVPLSQRLKNALNQFIYHNVHNRPGKILWWTFYAKNFERPITTRQVERIIELASRESIGRPIHPHVLRHTFASKLMRVTSSRVVQQLLGHKRLSSTQRYTHPNQEDLTTAINEMNSLPPYQRSLLKELPPGADLSNGTDTGGAHGDMG